jgi:FKBP-type peptidyl-prolyl cis-trans isomerase
LDDTSKWNGNDSFVERYPSGLTFKIMDSSYLASPNPGNVIEISYDIYYTDWDSTSTDYVERRSAANPFTFQFGVEEIIPGLNEAVSHMHLRERAIFLMPASIAYNESAIVFPDYLSGEILINKIIPEYATKVDPFRVLIFDATIQNIY